MSLYEPSSAAELKAHYRAVRARLWDVPPRLMVPQPRWYMPESEPLPVLISPEEIAERWREIDTRLFGKRVSPKAVIFVTAAHFNISVKDIISKSRRREIVAARHAAMYIMRLLCCSLIGGRWMPLSSNRVAQHFGQDHAAAFHDKERVASRMRVDGEYARAIGDIIALLWR